MQFISFCGVFVMLGICVALSRDRKAIRWKLVGIGLLLQAALGFVFLSWDAGNAALQACGRGVDAFLALSQDGTEFVFGALVDQDRQWVFHDAETGERNPGGIFVFAFMVLPTLIFFDSFADHLTSRFFCRCLTGFVCSKRLIESFFLFF